MPEDKLNLGVVNQANNSGFSRPQGDVLGKLNAEYKAVKALDNTDLWDQI